MPSCALAGDDLLLQLAMAVDPGLRQRPAPTVDAAHPAERQVARPDEEPADLFIAKPQSR